MQIEVAAAGTSAGRSHAITGTQSDSFAKCPTGQSATMELSVQIDPLARSEKVNLVLID